MALLDRQLSRFLPLSSFNNSASHSCRALLGILWENKRDLQYAWEILNHGVCDGCALGVRGLRDPGFDDPRLCMVRLRLLALNTMKPVNPSTLADVQRLHALAPERLCRLGRITYPMVRRREHKGFVRVGWSEALQIIAKSSRHTAAGEMAFFATARRLTNEAFYVFQKLARALGTNNIDSREASNDAIGVALNHSLGLPASTCSFRDLPGADLLLVLDSGLPEDETFLVKCIGLARRQSIQIAIIETGRPGERDPAALNGTIAAPDTHEVFHVTAGGEAAFLNGILKSLIAAGNIDREFIAAHTAGFYELKAALEKQSWTALQSASGQTQARMDHLAAIYGAASRVVFVCGPAPVQESTVETAAAIINLALARGMIGRRYCGILRLDGECAGRECGAAPDSFPGAFPVDELNARRFSNLWRHPVSSAPGLNGTQMLEGCHREEIKFLYAVAEDLLQIIPNRSFAAEAIARVPFRIHQDVALNSAMLAAPRDTVLVLPAQTRYEQRSGGTITSSDRRILFSPEIAGRRAGESLPDWEIPALIGRAMLSNGELLFPYGDTQSIREEMARVMPIYKGIERLAEEGDEFQWGGRYLYKDGFSRMPNSRARFTMIRLFENSPR
jgi:predicted molibdopterin-dependent oxidoreductase YjgC